jgi:tetratricopeptide (TPR) repeat protein
MTLGVVAFFLILLSPAEEEISSFRHGNALYEQGAFEAALEAYRAADGEAVHPGLLLYNQGCCLFQLGRHGDALRYFYGARKHLPRDERVAHNLCAVQARLGLEPSRLLHPGFAGLAWMHAFTRAEYGFAAGILLCLCFFLLVPRLMLGRVWAGRLSAACLCLALVVAGISLLAASDLSCDLGVSIRACEVLTEPSPAAGEVAFLLREGEAVRVGESRSGWLHVEDEEGRVGWARDGEVKSLP